MDQTSFVLGMITAFCECVAGGCKRLALSPPLSHSFYETIQPLACEIIERHGLLWYHEENLDLPEGDRFEWILIALKEDTLDQYRDLRAQGFNPACSLAPFYSLLSYNPSESIHTGYDAYKEFFQY